MSSTITFLTSESVSELFEAYSNELRAYIYQFMQNAADVDEVIQEVFLKAYTRIEKSSVPFENGRAWLYRIARNHCLNLNARRQTEHKTLGKLQEKQRLQGHRSNLDDRVFISQVADYVEKSLSEVENRIFHMRFVKHHNLKEISETLQKPMTTVFRLSENLMKKLQKRFI